MTMKRSCSAALVMLGFAWIGSDAGANQTCGGHGGGQDPAGRDSILDWNAIAIEAAKVDHTDIYAPAMEGPQQAGPTRASRALAIVHTAMFDAANSVDPQYEPYLVQ